MRIRYWLMVGMVLPALAQSGPPDAPPQKDNAMLLYASAFKVSEAEGCMRSEGARRQGCLEAVLTDTAMKDPAIQDALALIQHGNVRALRLCEGHERQEAQLREGIPAALWACHDVRLHAASQQPSSSNAPQRTLAFAMVEVDGEGDPGRVRIGQVLTLSPSSSASQEPGEDAVD